MASKLLIFNEVTRKAESVEMAGDSRKTFSKRKAPARPKAVTKDYVVPSDRELSSRVTQAIAELQDAMDAASRAGLIIEPSFKSVTGRFNEFGVSVESYICSVEIYRKLS
jgi:hypothetical protein